MKQNKNQLFSLSSKDRENESLNFVKDLHKNGFKFWSESEVNIIRKAFENGWVVCEQRLLKRIQQALENAVVYKHSDNMWAEADKERLLTDEQIEEIMKAIFK